MNMYTYIYSYTHIRSLSLTHTHTHTNSLLHTHTHMHVRARTLTVRLAWHASGTYDATSKTGGSDGATMRFTPEAEHGANAGLREARLRLEPVKAQFPGLTFADLWILASYIAIEEMGGPKMPFRTGRADKPSGEWCTPVWFVYS